MKLFRSIFAVAVVALLASCSHTAKWSVEGKLDGSEGELVTLERSFNGFWSVLDSVRPGADGSFKFQAEPFGYPDIYRLKVGDWTAYFPIDSIESVTLNADIKTPSYELSGSSSAVMLNAMNSLIDQSIAKYGRNAVNDSVLKQQLAGNILGDMGSIVSYYIINKEIEGKPIFDPSDKGDLRIIGAVVNSFSSLRPHDPRTRFMEQQYLAYRRAYHSTPTQLEAVEIGFPEINLKDVNGKDRSLAEIAGNGRPVIVNFTAYSADKSPAINVVLNDVYSAGGVEIYQVSIDADEFQWREAARNLPWVAVLNSPKDGDKVLREYNVGVLPMTFIIDGNGRLQERVEDLGKLSDLIKKYK